MAKKGNLRRRKTAESGAKDDSSSKAPQSDDTKTMEVGLPEDDTLKQTFLQHPLVRVAPFILTPYFIYQLIYFLTLRHPEVISVATLGLINLRPALQPQDPRQVLILGPEMPENRFVAGGMASPLKLEIVHEAFDAKNYFCRDGSVSWFQIMRFMTPRLPDKTREKDATLAAWKQLCIDRNHTAIQLFHPKEYDAAPCASYDSWSKCWAKECFSLVNNLWACENDDTRNCPQQFSKILHQVRHPLRTIETLNASICPYPKLKDSFLTVVGGFFPGREWKSMPCLKAMAWYTIDFHNLLVTMRAKGAVHGIFQIESTSPCEVAAMAGFQDEHSALYIPNSEKTTRLCRNDDVDTGSLDAMSQDLFARVKTENSGDTVTGLIEVKLEALSDDSRLTKEVKNLIGLLGYGKEGDAEFLV